MLAVAQSDRDNFSFTITKVVQVSQMVLWLEQARPGEALEYAEGFVEPRDYEGFKLAGAWAREGLVHLSIARPRPNREWKVWQAVRSSQLGKAQPAPRPRPSTEEVARIQMRTLLTILRRVADRGEVLPSYRKLALELTGQRTRKGLGRIDYLLRRLEAEGRITIQRPARGAQHGPQVTIIAKGRGVGKTTAVAIAKKGTAA